MRRHRLGAVHYLNARPLVHGLERVDRFELRFDPPSRCASLLHAGEIDLGMIPTVEYAGHPEYAIVPGVSIASRGAVDSVAVFSTKPLAQVQSIALDSSSRTSVALLRVLLARRYRIDPVLVTHPPDLPAMLSSCDAALLIGDAALFLDAGAAGLQKIDLGAEWTTMTGLPFVWAFWAGRTEVVTPETTRALQGARDAGVRALESIARAYCPEGGERSARAERYLRERIQFGLDEEYLAGLRRFLTEVAELGIAPPPSELQFPGASEARPLVQGT